MALNRILVADDEESMRWVLSKALRKKGFSVDLARDGSEALRMIKENPYEMAILDIKMPGPSSEMSTATIRVRLSPCWVIR